MLALILSMIFIFAVAFGGSCLLVCECAGAARCGWTQGWLLFQRWLLKRMLCAAC